ncbi:MAG: hypothetical protein LBG65_07635 [Puniceicoccales bacterium]|jgi:hypothetical protein|nr:hypothetical protein [Puniceicoccales bacterium]
MESLQHPPTASQNIPIAASVDAIGSISQHPPTASQNITMPDSLLQVSIHDTADDELRRLIKAVSDPRPLLTHLGGRLAILTREHFRDRDREPNKSRFPKTHFWGNAAKFTRLTNVTATTATVTIAYPQLLTKIHGGTIKSARPNGSLAIPISAQVYGKYPREFGRSALQFAIHGKEYPLHERGAVLEDPRTGETLYKLVRQTIHTPDPHALPPQPASTILLTNYALRFLLRPSK